MRKILFALLLFPILTQAQDTVYQYYVIIDSQFAVENVGYAVGFEQFNYSIADDSLYVTPIRAIQTFPELFTGRENVIVQLSDYDFVKPEDVEEE